MRLTVCLCSGLRDVTVRRWNNVWKCRGRFYDYPPNVPQALADKGVEIVSMKQTQPEREPWTAPDDPRFARVVPPEEQPDWQPEPAFSHHSNVRLFEGVKQACLIAKAQHFEGFPTDVERLVGAAEITDRDLRLQRAIMLSQVWNTDEDKLPRPFDPRKPRWNWTRKYGITRLKSSQILLRDLLRLCRSQVTELPSLRRRKQVSDLQLQSYVMYRGKPVVMQENLDMLLTSDTNLPPFAGEDVMDASVMHKLADMWPVYPTVDFLETNNYQLSNGTGFKKAEGCTCPHTIIQIPRKYHWQEKHYRASQIITCLMYTAALARRKFGDGVGVLPEPISVQHISLEQGDFLFTFFQLNTLDLDSETGVKNLVWTGEKTQLFQKILGQPWMPRSLRKDRYESYDHSAFEKFLAVYLNGVPELSSSSEARRVESV